MNLIACDLGGTRIKLALLQNGQVVERTVMPAQSDEGLSSRLEVIAQAIESLSVAAQLPLERCAGLGLAFPCLVDSETGKVLDEHGKYSDAPELDLCGWAQQRLGLKLKIENDARLYGMGEWKYGAGRGCDNLVVMTLGTGIGTAVVMNGQILRGVHGQAGILGGHLSVNALGKLCHCGNVGCVEREVGSAFLLERARLRDDFSDSALSQEASIDYKMIFQYAEEGDLCAMALLEETVRIWGSAVVNLIHAYDPEKVIVGGGIVAPDSVDQILSSLRCYVGQHACTPWGAVSVEPSALEMDAALLGCQLLFE